MRETARLAHERHPTDAAVLLLCASLAAFDRDYAGARALAERIDVAGLDAEGAAHAHHVAGVAGLRLGDAAAAREHFVAGLAHGPQRCELDTCLPLAMPRPVALDPRACGPRAPAVEQLLAAIRIAEDCLARGDGAGAVRALWRGAVLGARELQSAARLAAAYLTLEPLGEVERYRKTMALAVFCARRAARNASLVTDLPVPGAAWSEAELADLERRAAAWLERQATLH